jgi:hypothetical protein
MTVTIKELIVVLVIALAVFKLARPAMLSFTTPEDFGRRRLVWCLVTVLGFLGPDLWLFYLLCAPIVIWAGRRDTNPGALFLILMYAVPAPIWRVPMPGISYLVGLDFPFFISLCVMVPAARRLLTSGRSTRLEMVDYLLLAYLGLRSVYFVLPEVSRGELMTPTNTEYLRRACTALLSTYVPFFVLSRTGANRRALQDMLAGVCMSGAILAAIAVFEGARHWLLYAEMRANWGFDFTAYLFRGASLRAVASTVHSLMLGYLLAIAFGLWLSLRAWTESRFRSNAAIVLYWAGLLAAYSRGPWVGAIIVFFVYVALSHRRVSGLLKAALAFALAGCIVLLTPLGNKIMQVIPFLGGTVDAGNISYREQLLDRAWELVQLSPLLGDQHAIAKMEALRQGEGIVDIINGFANILLDNGFVGLTLFLLFVLTGFARAWRVSRARAQVGAKISSMGAAIAASIVATLVMMWTGGLLLDNNCILVALAAACARLSRSYQLEAEGADGAADARAA